MSFHAIPRSTAAIVVCLLLSTVTHGQVVINELAYDDPQEDDEEYVELFNAGPGEVDLTGWKLTTGGSAGPGPELPIPDGTTIPTRGHLVLGSPAVPNVDVAATAVDIFGDGPAFIALVDADGEVADAVAYETNKGVDGFPPEATEEGGIWGNHAFVPSTHLSWQRWRDGLDTDRNAADFGHLPWTPGEPNDRTEPAEFEDDFEQGDVEQPIESFAGSFVTARHIDPLTISPSNPNTIEESPDGGFTLVAWDPAGGGNFAVLVAEPQAAMMFEAWVYFDARPEVAGESETWSIGLVGTSGTYYNIPILYDANGNTGVTWTFQVTSTGAVLYLVDEGRGGPAASRPRLAEIPIVPGQNDGWQRLRLEVSAERVRGHFGGTYGSTDDGLEFSGTLREPALGSFYIGYREALANNTQTRPPTLDSLFVGSPTPAEQSFRRSDANTDTTVNLSDAVFALQHLFAGGDAPTCRDAADVDDSGTITITDPIVLLNHLFAGADAPPLPFPDCGTDPSPDDLGCDDYPACD